MDLRELRHKLLGGESTANIWFTDTQGELLPAGYPSFGTVNSGSPIYWKWTRTSGLGGATRLGSQKLGAQMNTSLVGDGVTVAFGPVTMANAPLATGSVSLWTKIAGDLYSWFDADGASGTFSDIVHAMGDGATAAFSFASKAIAIVTGTLQINWVSGGGNYSVTDDGAGSFTDAKIASSSINYDTGAISVTFAGGFIPDNNTEITLSGTIDSYLDVFFGETIALGDNATTGFTHSTENKSLRTGSFLFTYTISGVTYYAEDDGAGNIVDLYGAFVVGGSTVNYDTGAISLNLSSAPDQGTLVQVVYNKRGIIKSSINYTTGAISLEFDSTLPPDNTEKLFLLASYRDHGEFAGVTAARGLLLANESASRIEIRDARGYLDDASEGFDGSIYAHYCVPGDFFSLNTYIKRVNGTEIGYLRVRFWDGTSAYTQISAGTERITEYAAYSGDFDVVDDPNDLTKKCYQFSVSNDVDFDRCSLYFKVPAGARAYSITFETDGAGSQEGDLAFMLSGLQLSRGTADVEYAPSPETRYLPRPQDTRGRANQVLTWSQFGETSWADPLTLAVAAISSLNGLSVAAQTLTIGAAGNSPNWSSAVATHTLNIPLASTGGVTAGLVSNANYTAWQKPTVGTFDQAVNPNTFKREIVPASDNSVDMGTASKRWRAIYGVNVYGENVYAYGGFLHVGGGTNYARWSVIGADLTATKAGTVTGMDLSTFAQVLAGVFQANRLYALGNSDVVHFELKGHTTQTSNLFNIQNNGGSAYFRGDNNLNMEHVGNWDITNNVVSKIAFRVKGVGGQTADLLSIDPAVGAPYWRVDKDGKLYAADFLTGPPASGLVTSLYASTATGQILTYLAGGAVDMLPNWVPSTTPSTSVFNSGYLLWTRVKNTVNASGFLGIDQGSTGQARIYLDEALGGLAAGSITFAAGTVTAIATAGGATYSGRVGTSVLAQFELYFESLPAGTYNVFFSGMAN